MINSTKVLTEFNGVAPIFPLSNFVMFPKTAYSFNIFEPKYKEMIADIINKNKLFCTTLLKDHSDEENCDYPKFYKYGTLCYVIEKNELENGNYNIVVSGIKKVNIKEIESDTQYRLGSLEIIDDNSYVYQEEKKRKKLINKFISLVNIDSDKLDLNHIDTSMLSTEMLTNLASLILPLNRNDKQKLLELNSIDLRLDVLCQFMESELKVENDMLNFKQIIPTSINWN